MTILYNEYHCEVPGVARCYATYTPANPVATRYSYTWGAPFDTGTGYIPKPTATRWGSTIPYPLILGNGVGGHWDPGTSAIKVNQFDTLGAVGVLLYRDYDSITGWSAWSGQYAGMAFGFGVSKNGGAWTPVAFSYSNNDFKGYPLGGLGMVGANVTVPVPPYPGASTYSGDSKQIFWTTTGWSQTMGWGFGNHWDVRMWVGWSGGTTLAPPFDDAWWQSVGSAPTASGGLPWNNGWVTTEFSFDSQDYLPSVVIPVGVDLTAQRDIDNFFAATQPTITSFYSDPATLPYTGGSVDLHWAATDATTLSIDNGIGDVTGLTTINVPGPIVTDTMFTLTAVNGDIDAKAFASVFVDPASEPIIVSFDALPASFPFGGGMTHLSWVILGGTQIRSIIVGSDPPIDVSTLSEIDLPVTADTVFTLVSNGTGGLTDKAFVAVAVAPPALLFVSATPSLGHLAIQFSEDISGVFGAANDPEQWIITNTVTGLPLEVTAVSVVTNTVTLDTAEQVTGDAYTVIIPDTIVNTTMLMVFDGPQTEGFVGVGAQPTVLNINCVDARTIIIYFSEDVVEAEALNATNYAIDNGLLPVSLTKLSASVYKMTTTRQVTGTVYTATATGIHDLAGNPIT